MKLAEMTLTVKELRLIDTCIDHAMKFALRNLDQSRNPFVIISVVEELQTLRERLLAMQAEGEAKHAVEKAKHD